DHGLAMRIASGVQRLLYDQRAVVPLVDEHRAPAPALIGEAERRVPVAADSRGAGCRCPRRLVRHGAGDRGHTVSNSLTASASIRSPAPRLTICPRLITAYCPASAAAKS